MSLLELHTDRERALKAQHFSVERVRGALSEPEMDQVRPLISAALEHDLESMPVWDALVRIHRGDYGVLRVWANDELQAALVVTTRLIGGGRKALHVVACGGGLLEHWLDPVLDELHLWALDENCQAVTLVGRNGWERILRFRNYRRHAVVMVHDIEVRQ